MAITSLLTKMAKITNETLGENAIFTDSHSQTETPCFVIIDMSAEVQTEFGAIGSYDIEAILLKSEIASVSRLDEVKVGEQRFRINGITKETTAKYYCAVVKLHG